MKAPGRITRSQQRKADALPYASEQSLPQKKNIGTVVWNRGGGWNRDIVKKEVRSLSPSFSSDCTLFSPFLDILSW